jgi:hypothetical protein
VQPGRHRKQLIGEDTREQVVDAGEDDPPIANLDVLSHELKS